MENTILCNRTNCIHNNCKSCDVALIEIGERGCMDFREIDIYEEVEGFSRDWETD